jgi:hypothetical protein
MAWLSSIAQQLPRHRFLNLPIADNYMETKMLFVGDRNRTDPITEPLRVPSYEVAAKNSMEHDVTVGVSSTLQRGALMFRLGTTGGILGER